MTEDRACSLSSRRHHCRRARESQSTEDKTTTQGGSATGERRACASRRSSQRKSRRTCGCAQDVSRAGRQREHLIVCGWRWDKGITELILEPGCQLKASCAQEWPGKLALDLICHGLLCMSSINAQPQCSKGWRHASLSAAGTSGVGGLHLVSRQDLCETWPFPGGGCQVHPRRLQCCTCDSHSKPARRASWQSKSLQSANGAIGPCARYPSWYAGVPGAVCFKPQSCLPSLHGMYKAACTGDI